MRKKQILICLTAAFGLAWLDNSADYGAAHAQGVARRLVVLHPALGPMISAELNARYQLFGNIQDLVAVKCYEKPGGDFELRVMTASHMVIKKQPAKDGNRLRQDIGRRVTAMQQTPVPDPALTVAPVYPLSISGPEPGGLVKVVLDDETVLNGQIKFVTADTVGLMTPSGVAIALPETKIRDLHASLLSNGRGGKYYRADPNSTRLLFAPTGRGLRSGQGYFADYWIFFPTLAIGMSDFLGVGAGMSIFPGASSQLLYVAPKISFTPSESFSFATGFLYLGIPESDDITLGYGVITLGSSEAALTGGFGVPLTQDSDEFIFLIGGELQTSNRTKLITENWSSQG